MADQEIEWESFPPRWRNQSSSEVHKLWRSLKREQKERVAFMDSLKPQEWYCGRCRGELLYLICVFDDYIFVYCPTFGSDLYYFSSSNWKRIFYMGTNRLSVQGAKRIENDSKWRNKLKALVGKS